MRSFDRCLLLLRLLQIGLLPLGALSLIAGSYERAIIALGATGFCYALGGILQDVRAAQRRPHRLAAPEEPLAPAA